MLIRGYTRCRPSNAARPIKKTLTKYTRVLPGCCVLTNQKVPNSDEKGEIAEVTLWKVYAIRTFVFTKFVRNELVQIQ